MSPRTKTICILFGILTLAGLAVSSVLYFLIAREMGDIGREEQMALQKETSRRLLSSVTGEDFNLLSSRIVDAEGTVPLIELIETTGRNIGLPLSIDSVTVTVPDKKTLDVLKDYENLQIKITTQGSWQNTLLFTRALESLPYKSSIQSVTYENVVYTGSSRDKTMKAAEEVRAWRSVFILTVLKRK